MGCVASSAVDDGCAVSLKSFRTERVLGEGTFGKVSLAVDRRDGRKYALKTLDKERLRQKNAVKSAIRERSILISLSSADCSRFVTSLAYTFSDACAVYFVMDCALGGTLLYHLHHSFPGGFEEGHVRFYAAQLVCGLAHLHAQLILYRDLKPENTLLTSAGTIMLSDFGVSEALPSASAQTRGKAGTRSYMPPEALSGGWYSLTFDWYSLGVTLYQLLHDALPGEGGLAEAASEEEERPRRASLSGMRSSAPWATASPAGRAFVTSLRHSDADARLGAGGASEVRAHPFLAGVDWSAMQAGAVPAPFLPARSTANFELHADDVLNTLDGGLTLGARTCQPPAADDADFVPWARPASAA